MKVGDLVDDGLDNIGIIVEVRERILNVHFPDTTLNGWYEVYDLEAL